MAVLTNQPSVCAGEAANQRQTTSDLSQQLSQAEGRANSLENEVHRLSLQLTEKGLLLDVMQRERDEAGARAKELEQNLHSERELVGRAGARHQATQERLAQAQSEAALLRQQLEEAHNKGDAKERAVSDAQQRFSDMLLQLRADSEDRVQLLEDRNKELLGQAAHQRDLIHQLEEEKKEREVRRLAGVPSAGHANVLREQRQVARFGISTSLTEDFVQRPLQSLPVNYGGPAHPNLGT